MLFSLDMSNLISNVALNFTIIKTGKVTLEDEVPNKPEQLWNRISGVGNTQFSFKSESGSHYLTAPEIGAGVSSVKAEAAKYGDKVVVEYLALKDDGTCCIPSQMWKRNDEESTGYFTLANMADDTKRLADIAMYETEIKTGLRIQKEISGQTIRQLLDTGMLY